MHRAFVALGSNMGDRRHWLQFAVTELRRVAVFCQASRVYQCRAHPISAQNRQPDFLNAVLELKTDQAPDRLLQSCLKLERQAGRVRMLRNAPRTLDLDLLDVEGMVYDTSALTLPHPRLHLRRFVLEPWCDLAPEYYIGGIYRATVAQLLENCPDTGELEACSWTLDGLARRPIEM